MLRAAAGIVVVAVFVGTLMPGRSEPVEAANSAAPAEPWFAEEGSSTSSAGSTSPAGDGLVRLTRRGDGHFYADVEVNGTVVEFMIDTGATSIALTPEDAGRIGLRLDEGERTFVGQGAGGALTGHLVQLDRVELGHRTATGMRAAVVDGAETNLLGQSFLSRFEEVTVRGDVMTLR